MRLSLENLLIWTLVFLLLVRQGQVQARRRRVDCTDLEDLANRLYFLVSGRRPPLGSQEESVDNDDDDVDDLGNTFESPQMSTLIRRLRNPSIQE